MRVPPAQSGAAAPARSSAAWARPSRSARVTRVRRVANTNASARAAARGALEQEQVGASVGRHRAGDVEQRHERPRPLVPAAPAGARPGSPPVRRLRRSVARTSRCSPRRAAARAPRARRGGVASVRRRSRSGDERELGVVERVEARVRSALEVAGRGAEPGRVRARSRPALGRVGRWPRARGRPWREVRSGARGGLRCGGGGAVASPRVAPAGSADAVDQRGEHGVERRELVAPGDEAEARRPVERVAVAGVEQVRPRDEASRSGRASPAAPPSRSARPSAIAASGDGRGALDGRDRCPTSASRPAARGPSPGPRGTSARSRACGPPRRRRAARRPAAPAPRPSRSPRRRRGASARRRRAAARAPRSTSSASAGAAPGDAAADDLDLARRAAGSRSSGTGSGA